MSYQTLTDPRLAIASNPPMPAPTLLGPISRTAGLVLIPLLMAACADATTAGAGAEQPAARASAESSARLSNDDPRPTITPDLLDAYVRGMEEEIRLMQATGSHFISLSKYDEQGLQVAEKAGLTMREYRGLRRAVTDVLYAHLMHERYGGPAGAARLARLEPHKREHATQMLASEPFAPLSPAERNAVQARLDVLRPLYDRYMDIAAIAD